MTSLMTLCDAADCISCFILSEDIQGGPKMAPFLYALTLSTDFQNYFSVRIRRKFVIKLTKDLTTPRVCCYTCEMSSVLKAAIENNTLQYKTGVTDLNELKQQLRTECVN